MLAEKIPIRRDRSAPSARAIGIAPAIPGIALDIPAARLLVRPAGACISMRFVQPMRDDPDGTRFETLVRGLQLSSAGIRFVTLPARSDPADRVLGAFLVELGACAGRRRIGAGR
jgi:hypothetical protein